MALMPMFWGREAILRCKGGLECTGSGVYTRRGEEQARRREKRKDGEVSRVVYSRAKAEIVKAKVQAGGK